MRWRWWLRVTIVPVAGAVALAACGGDGESAVGAGPTLPPIVTTSTTTTTVAPATTIPEYYRIQRHDTLTKIAAAFGVPVQAIMDLNGITNPDSIQAGQIIALPSAAIVATELPPTVPGQTAPPGETTTTPPVPASVSG